MKSYQDVLKINIQKFCCLIEGSLSENFSLETNDA